jgi:endonuclease YncB( thermonuclease family)
VLLLASCQKPHAPGISDTVVRVHDGDTLTLAGGTRIRLAGIDANEINGSCHNACAPLSAKAAHDALATLVLHQRIDCEPTGTSYKRIVAWCSIGRTDLSCAQVASGAAIVWQRYDPESRLARCVPARS